MEWGKASGARKDWRVSEPSRSGLIFRENPGARNAWCGIFFFFFFFNMEKFSIT